MSKKINKPLIGVTSYQRNDEDRFTLPASYLDAVERADGIPMIIAPTTENIQEQLDRLDGVVLTGGADIDPSHYDGEHNESVYGVNRERDYYELELTRKAMQKKIPTLAICRGLQVLNVAMGGTLVEHIPDEYDDSIVHRGENYNKVEHLVSLNVNSRLAELLGHTEFVCASYHHQSVRRVAPGFRVVGISDDGVIEAIESVDHPLVIAVQWHPEQSASSDPIQQQLFNVFVDWARGETDAPRKLESAKLVD